ncbi:MAG: hypothetical protein WD397_14790 [Wenzhouxiangellaceae bacterium]
MIVLAVWIVASNHEASDGDRIVQGGRGSPSDAVSSTGRSEASTTTPSGPASDWPGLPSITPGQHDVVSPLQPEPADDERAPEMPLVELVEAFDDLGAEQRGEAAYRIASGWLECGGHQELDDVALRAEADRLVDNRSRWLTEMAAHALESGTGRDVADDVEQSIEEFAQKSREAHVAETMGKLREGQNFCRGADNPGFDERNLRYFVWLERAADLGHPPARIAFAKVAFFWSETVSVGEAVNLVERKRKVAAFLNQALALRNPMALDALAGIVRRGYYALPDPVLEYAYSIAATRALSGDAVGWRFDSRDQPKGRDLNMSLLRGRIEKLESALNPTDLRRAERISERILDSEDS